MQVFYGDGKDWVLISQPEANVLNVLQHICPPGPRRIRYSIFRTNVDQEEPLAPNAFAAMMASAHSASNWESLPAIFFNPGNGKERLFNELVAWARDRGCGFRADDNKAHDMLMKIAGVFFKLSGLEGALFERHAPLERKAPAELRQAASGKRRGRGRGRGRSGDSARGGDEEIEFETGAEEEIEEEDTAEDLSEESE